MDHLLFFDFDAFRRPVHQCQLSIPVLNQRHLAFNPIAVIAIQRPIDRPHFRAMNMVADDTVMSTPTGFPGYCYFKIVDVIQRRFHFVLKIGGKGQKDKPKRPRKLFKCRLSLSVNSYKLSPKYASHLAH